MELIKNKSYRITDIYGDKSKMRFISKGNLNKSPTYIFTEWEETLIISEDCIYKIESYKTVSPDKQARDKGKLDEYLKYMRIDGKKVRTKYIYKTIFTRNKSSAKA